MKGRVSEKNKVLLRVTTESYYYIDRSVNGWDLKTIIEDWFKDTPPDNYHATRDSHRIGGTTRLRRVKVVKQGRFKITKGDLQ